MRIDIMKDRIDLRNSNRCAVSGQWVPSAFARDDSNDQAFVNVIGTGCLTGNWLVLLPVIHFAILLNGQGRLLNEFNVTCEAALHASDGAICKTTESCRRGK